MTAARSGEAPPPGPVARVLTAILTVYRTAISPAFAPRCRFVPSCSAYALDAIASHGAGRGSWLALRRLLRCHPFHAGGHDPVPPRVPRADDGDSAAIVDARAAA